MTQSNLAQPGEAEGITRHVETIGPNSCWCRGVGGKEAGYLHHTGVLVCGEYCSCSAGEARRALDRQAWESEQRLSRDLAVEWFVQKEVPPHYATCSLASYGQLATTDSQRAVLRGIEGWLRDDAPRWLYLHGPYGVGKTCLAVAAAAAAIRRWGFESARFAVVAELLDELRHSSRSDAKDDAGDVLERYRACDLLVLDDLGAERVTDWAIERLFVLIGHRHDHHLATIVTSNLAPIALGEHLGERTMHRVAELSQVISTAGCPDLRAQARKSRLVTKQDGAA